MKADFTLTKVPRKKHGVKNLENGVVWYYIVYDTDGKRVRRSTGQTTKGSAIHWCNERLRAGKLLPIKRNKELFKTFADGFFDKGSPYVEQELVRGRKTTLASYKGMAGRLKNHIMPYFNKTKLVEIKKATIDDWMMKLKHKGVFGETINKSLYDLRKILTMAKERGIIPENPAKEVKPFVYESRERKPLSSEAGIELLKKSNIEAYWKRDKKAYYLSLIACLTGMRINEILSLRPKDIEENQIKVLHSRNHYDGEKPPKNGKKRFAPIPSKLFEILEGILPEDGKYIFSKDGLKPFSPDYALDAFDRALKRMGISVAQKKEDQLCIHGWRHYFITYLENKNINEAKIKAIVGHSEKSNITEQYTHFNKSDFAEVIALQEELLTAMEY